MLMEEKKFLKILICDDDPADRKIIKAYLSNINCYDIEFFEAGEEDEILTALQSDDLDLIFLDIQMPGRTGLEWLAEINKRKVAPVIILTGHGSELIAVDAMKNGAADYLPKSHLNSDGLIPMIENALEKWMLQKQLEEYRVKLEYLARTDELTGLMSRRSLMEQLKEEMKRSVRYKRPLSLLLLDLDGFKKINDVYGHLVGDNVIRTLAAILMESIRSMDVAGRYGGDEFVVILPETPASGARETGERIRGRIEVSSLNPEENQGVRCTVSVGVAELSALGSHCTTDDFLKKADEALYIAKKKGGNLVCS